MGTHYWLPSEVQNVIPSLSAPPPRLSSVPLKMRIHHGLGLEQRRQNLEKPCFLRCPTGQVSRVFVEAELASPHGKTLLHLGGMKSLRHSLSFGVLGFWAPTYACEEHGDAGAGLQKQLWPEQHLPSLQTSFLLEWR